MSAEKIFVARYVHDAHGQVLEIDVMPVAMINEATARFFIAYLSRLDRGELGPVTNGHGVREVFGPTEAWALQNACDLLDSAAFQCDRATNTSLND